MTRVGEILRDYRKRAGLTQEVAAERLDVSHQHLSRLETGTLRPSWQFLERFAKAFDVPVVELLQAVGVVPKEEVSELELAAYVAAYPDLAAAFEYGRDNPRLLADLARYAGMLIQEMGHDANNPAEDDRKESVPPD